MCVCVSKNVHNNELISAVTTDLCVWRFTGTPIKDLIQCYQVEWLKLESKLHNFLSITKLNCEDNYHLNSKDNYHLDCEYNYNII